MHNIRWTEDGWEGLLCTPTHNMETTSGPKQWPVFVSKQIRFNRKNRHHHPAFEETGNVANKNSTSTLENKISSEVKTTEQSLRGNVHTSRSLADYLKSESLVHASGEPGNEANKTARANHSMKPFVTVPDVTMQSLLSS